MKIRLNPKYGSLAPFVRQLVHPLRFARNGETLHSGRNTIKLFEEDGVRLAVKSYGRLSFFNRLIYGRLRKSKAERAYLHADRLRSLGIDTPEEVAFVEIRRRGILQASYFVSLYSDYLPLTPVTDCYMQVREARSALDSLVGFLFKIHWAGVLHKDLNIGNILYKSDGAGGYRFQVIDTNRMEFHRMLSMRQRLDNLRRLSCKMPAYLYILEQYARIAHADPNTIQLKGVFARLVFELRQRTKRKLKRLLVGL